MLLQTVVDDLGCDLVVSGLFERLFQRIVHGERTAARHQAVGVENGLVEISLFLLYEEMAEVAVRCPSGTGSRVAMLDLGSWFMLLSCESRDDEIAHVMGREFLCQKRNVREESNTRRRDNL